MPEIEAELAQKDEVISQLNSSIYELKVNFILLYYFETNKFKKFNRTN